MIFFPVVLSHARFRRNIYDQRIKMQGIISTILRPLTDYIEATSKKPYEKKEKSDIIRI